MNLLTVIPEIWAALQDGKELANPAKWKKGQDFTNRIGGVVAGVVIFLNWQFPNLIISEDIAKGAVEAIGGLLVFVNIILTNATSKKVGLRNE